MKEVKKRGWERIASIRYKNPLGCANGWWKGDRVRVVPTRLAHYVRATGLLA